MIALVLADTHLTADRADELVDLLGSRLEHVDAIIHAGDVLESRVLELLAEFAPVTAVRGNNDTSLDLPEIAELEFGGISISVVHDSGSASGRARRLRQMFTTADVVVFGHSHLPWNEECSNGDRTQIHFNPGSPTQRRRAPSRTIGWITVEDGRVTCRHEHLADGADPEVRG